MAAPPAPLPPEVAAQQEPAQQRSIFAANGIGQPQPGMEFIQQAMMKVVELESWAEDALPTIRLVQPGLLAHLAAIIQGGQQLKQGLMELAKRSGMSHGSPVMPAGPPGNPAAGPPNPAAF